MRRISLFLILLLLLTFLGGAVLAQEAGLPSPGLTPDSPFYFLDTLGEKIGMLFTFGAEKKAEKAIKYAEEKLAEVKITAEKNKIQAFKKASQKYQEFLGLANRKAREAKERGKDVERLVTLISERTLKHQEILLEVFEKVSKEAQKGIENAIEMSKKGFEQALEAVSGAKKEELQKEAEEIKAKVEEKRKSLKEEEKVPEEELPSAEEVCEKITDSVEKDECYYNLALKTKDASLCEKITDGARKDECYNGVAGEICKKITDAEKRNSCSAVAEQNPAWCERIANKNTKDACYMELALKMGDTSLCEKLSIEPYREKYHTYKFTCRALVERSLTECQEAEQKEVYGAYCYPELAYITKNSAFCEQYAPLALTVVLECKALVERNAKYCEELEMSQPNCYMRLAALEGNTTFCEKMPSYVSVREKEICQKVAKRNLSGLDCEKEFRACQALAILTQDILVCEKFWKPNYRDECYNNIAFRILKVRPIESSIENLGYIGL